MDADDRGVEKVHAAVADGLPDAGCRALPCAAQRSDRAVRGIRFFSNLGAFAVAVILIVAASGFPGEPLKWLALAAGILGLVFSGWQWAVMVHQRPLAGSLDVGVLGRTLSLWRALSGAIATFTTWQIVAAVVFAVSVSRWLTLANGIAIAVLASVGLIAHERNSERIVHVLEVVERPRRESW
jgi:hypothetical protein